ncbi:MAG: winged helix-turn-helix transcriptional regulator [Tissierellia bacterium]|nr:winged helix-turn-helix transcriptional regulator [Tissierellia bacterium]
MTKREREILRLIKENPMITQKQLADILGITRSSVAVHITNLMKKGYILGRGYILDMEAYVTVIGGANIDIQGFPYEKLSYRDSNPGTIKVSSGGVGRNIAENLAKLGVSVKLITAIGKDMYGNKLMEEAKKAGFDMLDSLILEGESTSSYISILDEEGDMVLAISHMDILDKISIDFIRDKHNIIENSSLLIVDTNIPRDVIEYIALTYKDKPIFLDTVSTTKAKKVKDIIGYFHTIKPNKIEAEILSGIKIEEEEDLIRVSEYFLGNGIKRVYISLGREGVFYNDGVKRGRLKGPKVEVVNTTGAGDAFVAALAYGYMNGYDIEECAKMGIASSILALIHEDTINPNMSIENIKNYMKEVKKC